MRKLLITDLDNTLYDWVTFFVKAFNVMVDELSKLISIDKEKLFKEFKSLHQSYGNTEQPFSILELPSVKKHFGNIPTIELIKKVDVPLHAFNSMRKKYLKLYDGVGETLFTLSKNDFIIVGHTEAIAENGFYRLEKLNILKYFNRLYAMDSNYKGHPDSKRANLFKIPKEFIINIHKSDKKPNPKLIFDICKKEKISTINTWYIGDSLVRDIVMAKLAGVNSIWARYGTEYDTKLWDTLVKVTHWTERDVILENNLKKKYSKIKPDYIINKFSEILEIFDIKEK